VTAGTSNEETTGGNQARRADTVKREYWKEAGGDSERGCSNGWRKIKGEK